MIVVIAAVALVTTSKLRTARQNAVYPCEAGSD
jgi:hypothetical protein